MPPMVRQPAETQTLYAELSERLRALEGGTVVRQSRGCVHEEAGARE